MNKKELKAEFERLCKIANNLNEKLAKSDDPDLHETLHDVECQIEDICDLYNYYDSDAENNFM